MILKIALLFFHLSLMPVALGTTFCLVGLFFLSADRISYRGGPGEGATAFRLAIDEVNRLQMLGVNSTGSPHTFVGHVINAATVNDNLIAITDVVRGGAGVCPAGSVLAGTVGPAFSSHALVTAVVSTASRVTQISPSATSPLLADRVTYSHFLRTTPSDDDSILAIVSLILRLGYKTVCGIVYDDDYGNAMILRLRGALLAHGVQVDTAVVFNSASLTAVGTQEVVININTNVTARGWWTKEIVQAFAPLKPKVGPDGRVGDERCFVTVVCSNGLLPFITQALKDMGRIGPKFMYLLTDATAFAFESNVGMLTPGFIREGEPALSEVAKGWLAVSPDPGAASLQERLELNALWANRTTPFNNLTNLYYDNGDRIPSTISSVYAYDAVLAYARALSSMYSGTAGPQAATVPSSVLIGTLYSMKFRGASGDVSFDRATGTRLGVGYQILNSRWVTNASGALVPAMVRVGKMSTGASNNSLELDQDGAAMVWPSGLSGLANAPSDRVVLNKVVKAVPRQVAVCLGVAAVAIALGYALSTAKLSITLPPAVLPDVPSSSLSEVLEWFTLAAEAWQLMSLALSAGPQDQGLFFSVRTGFFRWAQVEGVPQPQAFWTAAAITALIMVINLPLAAMIFDADRPKAVLGPKPRQFFQSWLRSVSWLALFYLPISSAIYFPLLNLLVTPLVCREVTITVEPFRTTKSSSIGPVLCGGSSYYTLMVVVAAIACIFLVVTFVAVEPFLQVSDRNSSINYAPAAMVHLTAAKTATIFVSQATRGYPVAGLSFHVAAMLFCCAMSRTTVSTGQSGCEFITARSTSKDLTVRYRAMVEAARSRATGENGARAPVAILFCTRALASRLRRCVFLAAALVAAAEVGLFIAAGQKTRDAYWDARLGRATAAAGFSPHWSERAPKTSASWALFIVAAVLVALLALEVFLCRILPSHAIFGGPVPFICRVVGGVKALLSKTDASTRLVFLAKVRDNTEESGPPSLVSTSVETLGAGARSITKVTLRWTAKPMPTHIVAEQERDPADLSVIQVLYAHSIPELPELERFESDAVF